jgi:hypothetical protein
MPGRSSQACADCVNLSAQPGIHVLPAEIQRRRGWPGHRRAKATPSFGRLCPAMTKTNHIRVDGESLKILTARSPDRAFQRGRIDRGARRECFSRRQWPRSITLKWLDKSEGAPRSRTSPRCYPKLFSQPDFLQSCAETGQVSPDPCPMLVRSLLDPCQILAPAFK